MDEDVIWPYVELYVNPHTVKLGDDGARAISVMEQTARAAGVIPDGLPPLRIVG
jgi:predicted solute-binding protein